MKLPKQSFRRYLSAAFAVSLICCRPAAAGDSRAEAVPDSQAPPAEPACQGMLLPGFEWALPCESKLTKSGQRVSQAGAQPPLLRGSITESDIDLDFGHLFDTMLDGALGSTAQSQKLDKAVARYRKNSSTWIANAKDAANFIIPYRGFAPSSEAADIILDEKVKVKDKHSAEYARQRLIDELHPQVVAKTMQLARAVGTKDAVLRDELVQNALASLTGLVGQQRAQLALSKLNEWARTQIPEAVYGTVAQWDVEAFQTKEKLVTKMAMDGDPVMQEIVKRLKKYNHHNPVASSTAKVVEGGLNVGIWVAPGYLIPAALELINAGYVLATGGTEERKLIKELYYDKRVESRYRTVNEESHLALTQYQLAANNHNPVLMMCCESIIAQLAGAENVADIVGPRTVLAHQSTDKTMTASSTNQSLQ